MFKKKKWLIVSILAAAVVVAIGAMGVSAYAKSNSSPISVAPAGNTASETAPAKRVDSQKVLADKVATILGLDNSTVESAFTQAQKEINTENTAAALKAEEARIDQMVTDGKITADQASQYKTWLVIHYPKPILPHSQQAHKMPLK